MTNYYLPQFLDETIINNNKNIISGRNRVFNDISGDLLKLLLSKDAKLNGLSIKRNTIPKIIIDGAECKHVAFTGSLFNSTEFQRCLFNVVHAQFCRFYNVKFLFENKGYIKYSDFSGSFFQDCEFRNVTFNSVSMIDSVFRNCNFINCKFRSSTFENTTFVGCKFEKVEMIHLNIEYSTMQNCVFIDSVFSWFQVPYINCFFTNTFNGNTRLYMNNHSCSYENYLSNLDKAIIYFTSQMQWFPLMSLYLLKKEPSYASNALNNSIDNAIKHNDIRTLGLCGKSGFLNNILTIKEIADLLKSVDEIMEKNRGIEDSYNRIIYSRVKEQLLNSELLPKLELNIQTGYSEKDIDKVGEICSEIDEIINKYNCKAIYRISHNSDPSLIISILGLTATAICAAYPYLKDLIKRLKNKKINREKLKDAEQKFTVIENVNIININPVVNITTNDNYHLD